MRKNKKRLYIIFTAVIVIGLFFHPGLAWGFNISKSAANMKQMLNRRIYIRTLNRKLFSLSPLVPQTSSPAKSRAWGTPLFKNRPRLKNFDQAAFKADMKKIRRYAESKLGKKTVAGVLKTGRIITMEIKTLRNPSTKLETNQRAVFKNLPRHKVRTETPRRRMGKNLFAPTRSTRPGQRKTIYPFKF